MRDVFSNETLKEINDLIDEIIENLDDNVKTVENPLSVSRENGIASIFTATNYDGTQRVFSASDTTIHILLDGNEDAGKSQRRSLKFTIGDKSGVAFEKNDDDTQYYIWWESDFGIDQQNDGCLWFRFDGDYGTDDTYPVKAYYTYKMTGLTAGKTYTITFTGGFGTTTPENFNLGGALIVSELVGQTMTTIAQEDFDSDAQTHSYSVTFTPTGTEVYLKFDFTNVIKTSDPHVLVFAVDEFTYTGLDLGVTGAYVWFDGWHFISTGGGGGTSDLDAIELTYAEYQALTPAEKTDPDKIYFITDYPSGSGVVINPTGTATDTAETIEVDGTIYDFMDADAVHTADIGVAGGVAELDANGKVPSSQLPSYVDDVVEYASISAFPATGESGKIYIALDTNKTYRWTGSVYVEISPSLALGETSSTAYRGDRGKTAYDHSQSDHSGIAPAFTEASTRANIASGETFATLLGKIKKFFSDLKAVAFTGAYADLSGTPTIPTVNNGTLTIKRNNTSVGTFTANQSSASNINIECATPSDVEGSKTATGSIVTVTDAADIYAEEVDVAVECTQTGSGTPSPSNIRPIQGYDIVSVDRCGKNLFDGSIIIGRYLNDTGAYYPNESYKCSEHPVRVNAGDKNYMSYVAYRIYYDKSMQFIGADQSGDAVVTVPANAYYMNFYQSANNTPSQIMVAKSNEAVAYEAPNHQEVSVQLGNKNLLPMTVEGIKAANTSGTWNGNVYSRNNVSFTVLTDENGCVTGIRCKGDSSGSFPFFFFSGSHTIPSNCKYNISASKSSSNWDTTVRNGNTDIAYIDAISGVNGDVAVTDTTFTLAFVYFNASFNDDIILHPMIRYSTDNPTFSPYNPTLGGMVYGGQLTLKDDGSAVFVGDRACKNIGELNFELYSADSTNHSFVVTTPSDAKPVANNGTLTEAISSSYEAKVFGNVSNFTQFNSAFAQVIEPNRFVVRDVNYTSASAFKTAMASQQIVYPLATPFTIHLSAEQLRLLKGYNYISSNGATIHLTYQPDNAVGDAVSKAEKYTDRLCKTGVVDTFNLYNGNTKVGSVSLLSNGFKLLYMNSIDDGSMFGINIPDKYIPKGPYQRAVVCLEDGYANPRIIEIYQNHITVTEDKFEHGDTYGTGLYY